MVFHQLQQVDPEHGRKIQKSSPCHGYQPKGKKVLLFNKHFWVTGGDYYHLFHDSRRPALTTV
jgi:predicted aconitase with swiveling domain